MPQFKSKIRSSAVLCGLLLMFGTSQEVNATNYFNWDAESTTTSIGAIIGYHGGTTLDCTVRHSGSCSMKITVYGPDGGNQGTGADVNQLSVPMMSVGGPSIYYRTWLRFSSDFNWGAPQVANVKTTRGLLNTAQNRLLTGHMRSDGFYVAECDFVNGYGGGCLTTTGVPNNDYNIRIPYNVQGKADGLWHEYIIRIKPNTTTSASDAEFQVWVDGVSIGQLNGWRLATTSAGWIEAWNGWMVKPYFQMNGDSTVGGTVWVDDFSTDDTWNSLIVGSGSLTLPALPQITINTTYTAPAGSTITVNAGENFQTALNNAQLGDTIVLQAGATFTGPFTLPNKTTGSGWIYIRSSAYSSLPAPGNRVSPTDAANMPILTATGNSVITTVANSHHYRFVGIEIKPTPGSFIYNLISIGNNESTASTLPNNITFDRCYIHGDPSVGGRRGVAMDGNAIAVVDSYVSNFKEVGADTQALWAHNGQGPYKIVNNYLEAAGENVMFGGADPSITNSIPSDIEIRRNHFFKPLSWIGSSWVVKNLLELKNAKRVLVEGNIFENNWAAAQSGFSILFTPRNQNGSATWSAVQDVTIRLNKGINLGSGINISGADDLYQSDRTRRVLIENNVLNITGLNGAEGRVYQILSGPTDVTVRHNTTFTSGSAYFMTESNPKADQFVFQDNITSFGQYGFIGTGTADGLNTLNTYYTNFSFTKNAIIGGNASNYSGLNSFFPADPAAVGFANYNSGEYQLLSTSPYYTAGTDGKDLGADIGALTNALNGVQPAPSPALPPPQNVRVQ